MTWYDLAGSVGVVLIVAAYLLLQLQRVAGTGLAYLLANAVGAALILLSLAFDFNLSAFLMEAFWLGISLFGLTRHLREPGAGRAAVRRLGGQTPRATGPMLAEALAARGLTPFYQSKPATEGRYSNFAGDENGTGGVHYEHDELIQIGRAGAEHFHGHVGAMSVHGLTRLRVDGAVGVRWPSRPAST